MNFSPAHSFPFFALTVKRKSVQLLVFRRKRRLLTRLSVVRRMITGDIMFESTVEMTFCNTG